MGTERCTHGQPSPGGANTKSVVWVPGPSQSQVLDKEPPESLRQHCPVLSLASTEKTESVTCSFCRARTYKHHGPAILDICQTHTPDSTETPFASSKCVPHPTNPSLPPFNETQAKQPAKVLHPAAPERFPDAPTQSMCLLNHMSQHSQQGTEGLEVWSPQPLAFPSPIRDLCGLMIQQKGMRDHCANLVCSQQKRKEVQKGKLECPGLHTQTSTGRAVTLVGQRWRGLLSSLSLA